MEAILDENNFSEGDKHYLQSYGGTVVLKFGKNYACTYMRNGDERLMKLLMVHVPLFCKRLSDDGFGIMNRNSE